MSIAAGYFVNACYTEAWHDRVAPALAELSERNCHVKQIRIRGELVTIEVLANKGDVSSLKPNTNINQNGTVYQRHEMLGAVIVWEVNHAD